MDSNSSLAFLPGHVSLGQYPSNSKKIVLMVIKEREGKELTVVKTTPSTEETFTITASLAADEKGAYEYFLFDGLRIPATHICTFDGCEQLATVDFAGKVNEIRWHAFADTAIKDIQIPDGEKVDPDAFDGAPLGNKKSLTKTVLGTRKQHRSELFLRKML